MKKNVYLTLIGLLIMLLFVGNAARFYRLDFVDQLAAVLYDYQLRLTMPGTVNDRIVILDIDEKSLQQEGRWPWSRDRLGQLVDKLFDRYKVAVAGFDVVFAEKDECSGLNVLQQLGRSELRDDARFQDELTRIRPQLEYDRLFADKLRNRKVVLGYYLNNQANAHKTGLLPPPVFPAGMFQGTAVKFTKWSGYGANLPELQHAAASAGYFNFLVDFDGEVRRVPMLVEYGGAYYESLALAIVRTLLGQPPLVPGFVETETGNYGGLEWLQLEGPNGTLKIPVDSEVAAYVPYRGGQGSFRYISLADVLHDRIPPAQLRNKIVLIGTTAPGLLDLRSTPVAEVYPGVEVHANMIAGILEQDLKQRPAYMLGAEVMWLLLIGISLSVLMPKLEPGRAMLAAGFWTAVTVGLSLLMWRYGNTYLPVANTALMIALLFALDMSYGYFIESRVKRQITSLFGQYVPGELVEEMSRHPEHVSMEGKSCEMTVLFSDVRGFTRISEALEPKELTLLMNEFLTPLSRVVYKYRGTIDKYMGDCIMAFWGAPLPDPQHARNALLAGIEMQTVLKELQPRFHARGWPEIQVGVGINTGRVSVGNMGSEVRVAYTVMGDAVNLASRLEGLTKQYRVGVIVGEKTRNAVPDIVYRELDHVRVKGKDKPVAIYEPVGLAGEVSPTVLDEIAVWHDLRAKYGSQAWEEVEQLLQNLQRLRPDVALYRLYAGRVAYFREHPPAADWDGVFVYETK